MNPIFKKDYTVGFAKEKELMSLLESIKDDQTEILESNENEDIHEHIDFKIVKTYNVDVKSLRKVSRSDSIVQEDLYYLEILNVKGNKGSLYAENVTHFAFETFDSWFFVEKKKIHELVKNKVKKEVVNSAKECLYKLYRREGRKDLITMVKTIDLMNISCEIIKKNDKHSI